MLKNVVQIAMVQKSKGLEKLLIINSALDVKVVLKPSFGRNHTTKAIVKNTGLNFGSKRATPLDNWSTSLVTAKTSFSVLKTIGFLAPLMNLSNIPDTNISFLMVPTSTKEDVL